PRAAGRRRAIVSLYIASASTCHDSRSCPVSLPSWDGSLQCLCGSRRFGDKATAPERRLSNRSLPIAMALPSHRCEYLRPASPLDAGPCPGRLGPMRVRSFELRLIGAALTVLWTLAAGLVLLGYRPGGPIDLAVGVA